MTEPEVRTTPTYSAAWHWEQAEQYMSLASYMEAKPEGGRARAVDTYNQQLWAQLATAHATLAQAGATILAPASHGNPERMALLDHAGGRGRREV